MGGGKPPFLSRNYILVSSFVFRVSAFALFVIASSVCSVCRTTRAGQTTQSPPAPLLPAPYSTAALPPLSAPPGGPLRGTTKAAARQQRGPLRGYTGAQPSTDHSTDPDNASRTTDQSTRSRASSSEPANTRTDTTPKRTSTSYTRSRRANPHNSIKSSNAEASERALGQCAADNQITYQSTPDNRNKSHHTVGYLHSGSLSNQRLSTPKHWRWVRRPCSCVLFIRLDRYALVTVWHPLDPVFVGAPL